jgi:hypothetical protein
MEFLYNKSSGYIVEKSKDKLDFVVDFIKCLK